MENDIDADRLLNQLSQSEIVIYGSGSVGRRFLNGLKRNGLKEQIVCFAVSSYLGEKYEIEGIPVQTVEELMIHDNTIVCIAVHEALRDEMIQILKHRKIEKYIWIYPFLYHLLLGHPIETDRDVDVNKIIQSADDYRVAVRYMAIEQYFGKSKTGYDLYVRSHLVHCEKKTAEKRLQKFCDLIRSWEKNGMTPDSRILINRQYQIIDGHHRIAAAKYFKQQKIKCNIFPDEIPLEELHGKEAVLTEQILRVGGFSEAEIKIIDAKNKYIKGE